MILFYIISVLLISDSTGDADNTGTVAGRVTDPNGNPLIGATVMVHGSSLGAMTNPNGEYAILHVPVDRNRVQARMVGMGESTKELALTPGDTTTVDFILMPEGSWIITLEDKLEVTDYSDTLEVTVKNWRNLDLEINQAWTYSQLCPSWPLNDSTLAVALPQYPDSFNLWVYPGQVLKAVKPEDSSSLSVSIRLYTEPSPEQQVTVDIECLDVSRWGNSNLIDLGVIGFEVAFSPAGEPRILLVYNEQAVLLDGNLSPRFIEYPFPTLHYRTDTELNHLLIWDIYGEHGVSGDAAIISLDSGSFSVFDPTPGIQEGRYHLGTGAGTTVINLETLWIWKTYLVTTTGQVVRLDCDHLRVYDSSGSIVTNLSLNEISLEVSSYYDQFLSLNESAVSALFYDGTSPYCMTLDLEGRLLNLSKLPIASLGQSLNLPSPNNPSTAVVWKPLSTAGIARIDCLSGDFLYRPGLRTQFARGSQDSERLGVVIFSNTIPNYAVFEVWDWNTAERISSAQYPYYHTETAVPFLESLLDGDEYLFCTMRETTEPRTRSDIVLADKSGEVIWVFPVALAPALASQAKYCHVCGDTAIILSGKFLFLAQVSNVVN